MSSTEINGMIEEAMAGVRIVACGRCHLRGMVGLPSLSATCPDCGGSGRTTTNELEIPNEVEPRTAR